MILLDITVFPHSLYRPVSCKWARVVGCSLRVDYRKTGYEMNEVMAIFPSYNFLR